MSCPLVDQRRLEPGGAELPLQVGGVVAFSGRLLAVRTAIMKPNTPPADACAWWLPTVEVHVPKPPPTT